MSTDAGLAARVAGVSATLYIPLFARALESQRPEPFLRDPTAVELTDALAPLLAGSNNPVARMAVDGRIPHLLCLFMALRARHFDAVARAFMTKHPDGLLVNLGCGLDTRYQRLDDGAVELVDLDLPDVIALKRSLLSPMARYHMLAASVLDFAWMDLLPRHRSPILFMAEGLFMYLPPEGVRDLVLALQRRFPGSELLCEVFNRGWLTGWRGRMMRRKLQQRLGYSEETVFQSGIDDSRALEGWAPGLRLLGEWSYFDEIEPRLGVMRLLGHVESVRHIQWTVHYRLDAP